MESINNTENIICPVCFIKICDVDPQVHINQCLDMDSEFELCKNFFPILVNCFTLGFRASLTLKLRSLKKSFRKFLFKLQACLIETT